MAGKDGQSSQSFSQSTAGGVMARTAKVAAVREDDSADVDGSNCEFTFFFTSRASKVFVNSLICGTVP